MKAQPNVAYLVTREGKIRVFLNGVFYPLQIQENLELPEPNDDDDLPLNMAAGTD